MLGFVKDHPVISALSVFAVIGLLAVLASIYSTGTLVDSSSGCGEWMELTYPETGEAFTSVSEFENFVEENGGTAPEDLNVQMQDGVLHQKLACVNMEKGGN